MELSSASIYTDINGLNELKRFSSENQAQGIHEAAKQFEALFLQMVLKSMREANNTLKSDLFNSNETQMYQEMFDQQLALNLSDNGGIGLTEVLTEQMTPKTLQQPTSLSDPYAKIPPMAFFLNQDRSFNIKSDANHAIKEMKSYYDPFKSKEFALQNYSKMQLTSPSQPVSSKIEFEDLESKVEIPSMFENPQEFLQAMKPYAEKASKMLGGVDPKILLAQAALETGWGQALTQQGPNQNSFNLFGIKSFSNWDGDSVSWMTHEYENGKRFAERAEFRKYNSYEESFTDYANYLLSNEKYQNALAAVNDPERFVEHLQSAGYATDPNYAQKIKKIFWSPTVQQL